MESRHCRRRRRRRQRSSPSPPPSPPPPPPPRLRRAAPAQRGWPWLTKAHVVLARPCALKSRSRDTAAAAIASRAAPAQRGWPWQRPTP
eukprot:scaffold24427_cov55-Phaeocystis_antarctica.AAC.1